MRYTVVGTFYARHENSLPLLKRLYIDATRPPDEALLMCETPEDAAALIGGVRDLYDLELLEGMPDGLDVRLCPTPTEGGKYQVIPYAWKINEALSMVTTDAVVYLDNNSDPKPRKYQVMVEGLEANPGWGAVYCSQKRTGFNPLTHEVDAPVYDGFCVLNYTQVMHRPTADRWPLDMRHADPDLADGYFWRSLHETLGPFYPVGNAEPLDEHHIPHAHAAGLKPSTST